MSTTSTASLWRVCIEPKRPELDAHAAAVLKDIHELPVLHVQAVASRRLFFIESALAEADLKRIAGELLTDPITEQYSLLCMADEGQANAGEAAVVEVHLKGGVMDPVSASTLAAVADMGIDTQGVTIATGRLYQLRGVASLDELNLIARRVLYNDCIEQAYLTGFGHHDPRPAHLPVAPEREFELQHVAIRELDDDALVTLSRQAHLFLSLPEMQTIRHYYREQGRDPTDLELEMLAQTWSEHCVHKTLKSAVHYAGEPMPAVSKVKQDTSGDGAKIKYANLLKETVARATFDLIESGRVDWCLSVFEDNAGVIAFDDDHGLAFKVETHNHPSAIEPYGGAATGAGGCIRDVMGCGLGAKPIANTDIFCVGKPDFPLDLLPKGVLHPRRILKGVVSGVRDYGNRMGIPTVNGAILFDDRYLGNPLVFCGCLGVMPRNCIHKEPRPGDLIVVIGGRTGRDGIHGATFSSAELTDTHADEFSHAVQIGNAITEKQVLDVMMQARDHEQGCLYTATTDCGAGGLSSAVGEMAEKLGADVELHNVPLKYAGLRYDEIWISEAQERMVLSVPPKNWETFKAICDAENVEATSIGTFSDDGKLVIRYEDQVVGELDTKFLHGGIPGATRKAQWQPPKAPAELPQENKDPRERLLGRLAQLNTASKEWVIRQYDHEVQGRSVIKPLVGPGEGPSDGAVLRPLLTSQRGVALACGICPELSDVDPYWMAVAAVDEAVRNIVCVGGDPSRTAILDNFCWGNCEDPRTMGALVRACQGCYDAAITYGTPFISGKDSLNNEFALDPADAKRLEARVNLFNNRIRIPETLLISAISVIEDVSRCVTMDAKQLGIVPSSFWFVGLEAEQWDQVDPARAAALHAAVAEWIAQGQVAAAHDCGSEGCLMTLAEMAFAGQCGMDLKFQDGGWPVAFDPVPSGYVLQVRDEHAAAIEAQIGKLAGVSGKMLGRPTQGDQFKVAIDGDRFEVGLAELSDAWRGPLNW